MAGLRWWKWVAPAGAGARMPGPEVLDSAEATVAYRYISSNQEHISEPRQPSAATVGCGKVHGCLPNAAAGAPMEAPDEQHRDLRA
jgi:hypothetical protein